MVSSFLASRPVLQSFINDFLSNKGAVIGFVVFVFVLFLALFANFIAPYDPYEQFENASLLPPVWSEGGQARFLLGTDNVGRDILSRLIYGSRLSLLMGCIIVLISVSLGTTMGLIAGYLGGVFEYIAMRIVDILLAVPGILLAMAIVAILGPGLLHAAIAIGIVAVPPYIRLARASMISEKSKDYVTSCVISNYSNSRIVFSEILPNCVSPLIVQATLGFSGAILEAAGLSFLGLGAQPPAAEWGTMLSTALEYMRVDAWLIVFPGLAILVTVISLNLMGDGIRDALDPKLQK